MCALSRRRVVCLLLYLPLLAALNSLTFGERPLEGRNLTCCALLQRPIIFRTPKNQPHGFDGLAVDYLNRLQHLLGFQCLTLKEFRDVGVEDVGFTAFLRKLDACASGTAPRDSPACKCDLGVGGWMLSEERLGLADFLPAFVREELRVIVHVDSTGTSIRSTFFLSAFSIPVWLAIAGLVVVFAFLKLLDKRFAPPESNFAPLPRTESRFRRWKYYILKGRVFYRLRRAIQSALSKMVGHSIGEIRGDFGSTRQWVLNFTIVLCGLFLVLVYEATMTASLVQETFESEFRTVEDLKSCHIPTSDVCIPGGGIVESFWKKGIATERNTVAGCKTDQDVKEYNSYEEAVDAVALKACKFLITDGATTGTSQHGRHCRRTAATGTPFFENGASFVLPRNSKLTKVMSEATLQLKEQDVLESLDQYFARKGVCKIQTKPTLTFQKLQIFFYLAFGACICIFLEMVLDPQTVTATKPESKDRLQEVVSDEEIPAGGVDTEHT